MKTRMRNEDRHMGEMAVPEEALYGAQTARAVENFPISGTGIGREMIRALGLIKKAAALVNREVGRLDPELCEAIAAAAEEVAQGDLDAHFPVDVFQTGSGTSSNMNANEVISNRAIQLLGGTVGSKSPVHPNDHVNMGQSSNDVFPTAIHVAALSEIQGGSAAGSGSSSPGAVPQVRELRRYREDRPNPLAGRHAHSTGAGVLGLRVTGRTRHPASHFGERRSERAPHRWHCGRNRDQHPSRVRQQDGPGALAHDRHGLRRSHQPLRGPVGSGCRGSDQWSPQVDRGEPDQDRR